MTQFQAHKRINLDPKISFGLSFFAYGAKTVQRNGTLSNTAIQPSNPKTKGWNHGSIQKKRR
jgi:hypothetical protein